MAATTRQKSGWITANIVTILLVLIPVLWIVSLSFKDPSTIAATGRATFWPTKFTWANYSGIFSTSEFTRPLLNSIGIGLIATFISVVFASLAAYAVARLDFPGKGALIGFSLLIAMFPLISLVTPLFNIERALGIFNTWIGLIIPYIAFGLPLGIDTLSAFFREIPWELEKAARVDGATAWQRFYRVTLPLMKPAILVALLFRTLDAFRIFDNIYILTGGGNGTYSVSILGYDNLFRALNLGIGSAISILIFISVAIIATLFIKGFGAAVPGSATGGR